MNRDSRIEFVNEGFEQLANFERQEILGRSVSEVFSCEAENDEKMEMLTERIRSGLKESWNFNAQVILASILAAAEVHPVAGTSRDPSQFVMFVKDITAQRLVEKEKAKLTEELLFVSRQAGMSENCNGRFAQRRKRIGRKRIEQRNVSASVLQRNIGQSRGPHARAGTEDLLPS